MYVYVGLFSFRLSSSSNSNFPTRTPTKQDKTAGLTSVIRRFAPYDTYAITKRGRRVRIDGTLMGLDARRSGLLPQWRRGAFSILFDGSDSKLRTLFVNREKARGGARCV